MNVQRTAAKHCNGDRIVTNTLEMAWKQVNLAYVERPLQYLQAKLKVMIKILAQHILPLDRAGIRDFQFTNKHNSAWLSTLSY